MKHGDFTGLADDYALYRPDYSPAVLRALVGLSPRPFSELDVADVGAGTGIWTRMLATQRPRTLRAIEPNDDMRSQGQRMSTGWPVQWSKGSGEETGFPAASLDFVSMASSFHWVDFEKGISEFFRVLRPGGLFVALWNPRYIEANPLLVEIEEHLKTLKPQITRVSSGRSGLTDSLLQRMEGTQLFSSVSYLESKHVIEMSHERYLGVWRSVNDLRVQLGSSGFDAFLAWVEKRIAGEKSIRATYLTRAWVGTKP